MHYNISMSRAALERGFVEYRDAPRNGRWRSLSGRVSGDVLADFLEVFVDGRNGQTAHRATPVTAVRELRAWLTGFAVCVRQQDYNRGRNYFHPDAYCFGSYARACTGRDALVRQQWRKIWPHITGFQFQMRQLRHHISADDRMACAMVPWRSIGQHADGTPFQRNGRVTIVLTRTSGSEPWRALHTHYSLNPGTPQTTARSIAR